MKQPVGRAQLVELVEKQPHDVTGLLIGIKVYFPSRQDHVTHRHADEQLTPLRLIIPTALQAVAHDVQFHFTHDPLEAQQETVVGVISVVDAILVGDERTENGAHLEEGMPVLG